MKLGIVINPKLEDSKTILEKVITSVEQDFDARRSAISKEYFSFGPRLNRSKKYIISGRYTCLRLLRQDDCLPFSLA